MSRTCQVCGRGPLTSATRSHSNIKTKKKKYLNLQTKKINGKKIKICAKCLKTKFKKARAKK
ncbi:MAG TPA: 50S ribosomal protein L28 [Candidatus Uhrbacteria bacterium]|nr:50S ribosomal protein L28 [Candidatus Uhrbacteria bacterium]